MSVIAIDARESGTSTGRYIDKLIGSLHEQKPAEQIIVLAKPDRADFFRKNTPDFRVIESPFKEFTFSEQLGFMRQLRQLKVDLVHFGMVQQPILYRGQVVTTIHDLTTTRFTNPDKKRTVFALKQVVYRYVIKRAAHKSAAVLVPSQFVKDGVVAFTGVAADKITVTYEAASPITDSLAPLPDLLNKNFIMYIGRPTPHKNLPRLIEAFGLLRAQHPDLVLVLAGKKDANYKRIEASIPEKLRDYVYFTDYISDGQLRWLYEHCVAYVFPSLSEGFGLPGLEAMVHGAPVVSSDATCLPEIYGNAAHYFNPLNEESMADAINEVITDASLRAELIEKGRVRVSEYSWQRMAKQTQAVYSSVLK